jgi:hypothetical protein
MDEQKIFFCGTWALVLELCRRPNEQKKKNKKNVGYAGA